MLILFAYHCNYCHNQEIKLFPIIMKLVIEYKFMIETRIQPQPFTSYTDIDLSKIYIVSFMDIIDVNIFVRNI